MSKISSVLTAILKARGLEANLSEYRILGSWEKAVGPAIARHARPSKLRGKKLFLTVDSPAWMQQLSLLKPEITEKVNATLGRTAITEITLRLGELAVQDRPAEESRARPPLDSADYAIIEQYIKDIRDPDTRAAVKRVIEMDLKSKKGSSNLKGQSSNR